ncbi:MAG: hypothetical protein K6E40_04935 [Desulfovibrio sp.]|nr:hypothetical protein [Desulfovibrio sp.]
MRAQFGAPGTFTGDLPAAVDFPGLLDFVDRERTGNAGICAPLAETAVTAAAGGVRDMRDVRCVRIKAVAVSAIMACRAAWAATLEDALRTRPRTEGAGHCARPHSPASPITWARFPSQAGALLAGHRRRECRQASGKGASRPCWGRSSRPHGV